MQLQASLAGLPEPHTQRQLSMFAASRQQVRLGNRVWDLQGGEIEGVFVCSAWREGEGRG